MAAQTDMQARANVWDWGQKNTFAMVPSDPSSSTVINMSLFDENTELATPAIRDLNTAE
jgi:hypothetical protein